MPKPIAFAELVLRCRNGDQQAITELVRQYEPLVRRWAQSRVGRLDPESVCQSVLKSLFVGLAAGRFELPTRTHLEKLLHRMARNKSYNRGRKKQLPIAVNSANALLLLVDPSPAPEQVALAQDLRQRLMQLLSPGERRILAMRLDGADWDEIGTALGVSAPCVRMRFMRAMRIATARLGLH